MNASVSVVLVVGNCVFILVCIVLHSESQNRMTSATKRPAIALQDDDDDDDRATCPSTLSDQQPPEVVRRRAPQPEKHADDEPVVVQPRPKSPTGTGFQLMTSLCGVAAPPPLLAYRSAVRIPAPPPNATAFQLVALHNMYATQQHQQQQLRQHAHQLSPHLRFSLFTDLSSAPGI